MLSMLCKHSVRSLCFAFCACSIVVAGCAGGSGSSGMPYVANAMAQHRALSSDAQLLLWPDAQGKNVVQNGTFDTGKLAPWKSCGTATAAISELHPYDGKYDALTGSPTAKSEVKGWSAICQTVKVPTKATLSAELYRTTNEKTEKDAYQEVALASADGKPTTALTKANVNHAGWEKESWDLEKFAGKTVTLFFGVYGSDRKKFYDTQFVDDVTLTGTSATTPPLNASPASLTFTSSAAQSVSVSESGFSGTFTASSSDNAVATVSPSSAKGPKATFDVTPVGGGTCTIDIADGLGGKATVSVTVDNGVIHVSALHVKSAQGAWK